MNKKGILIFIVVFIAIFSFSLSNCNEETDLSSISSKENTYSTISFNQFSLPSYSSSEPDSSSSRFSFNKSSSSRYYYSTSSYRQSSTVTSITPYSGHYYTERRGKGDCKLLTGEVVLTVFLVSDAESSWDSSSINEVKKLQQTATYKLNQEAKKFGASLNVKLNYVQCRVISTLDPTKDTEWVKSAVKAAGYSGTSTLVSTLKKKHSVNEAPVMFMVNRTGRAYAIPHAAESGFEYAILYRTSEDYRHELFHMYGALDYYFPDKIATIADKYFPNSIMRGSTTDVVVDDLTAYQIGWTDTLTAKAKKFLDETTWVDNDYISDATDKELFTGYGTIDIADGTYTGDIVMGVPEGKGKITWNSGNTYEGELKNGVGAGYGVLIFKKENIRYEGNFKGWSLHGQGKITWGSGDTYEGELNEGVADGYGVMIWKKAGCTYKGYFKNWKQHGQGTCTFKDGTVQSGLWENGKFIG